VWSGLAKAQRDGLRIKDSIGTQHIVFFEFILTFFADSYIKAEDPSNFTEVIEIFSHAGKHDGLLRFLQMARKSLRGLKIDTELAYAYAKTDRLHGMGDFFGMTNIADILVVGEKCFEDELYPAAKLLFTGISNWARLATTLIYPGREPGNSSSNMFSILNSEMGADIALAKSSRPPSRKASVDLGQPAQRET
jgi:clathrin heavy chain